MGEAAQQGWRTSAPSSATTYSAVRTFISYVVTHPIKAQCTHCNARCTHLCAGALQQPLPISTYTGGIFLCTIPRDPHLYLLPKADRHLALPLQLSNTWQWDHSPFLRCTPQAPSDGRPPDEPTHATQGPKRAIALLSLQAKATIPRDLEGENYLVVEGLMEHVLITAMYATAAASGLCEDHLSPPLAEAA